jgi:hypothetical protein
MELLPFWQHHKIDQKNKNTALPDQWSLFFLRGGEEFYDITQVTIIPKNI